VTSREELRAVPEWHEDEDQDEGQEFGATDEERDEALDVITEAARSWLYHLRTVAIPNAFLNAPALQEEADEIEKALDVLG
jgi:hypothetical protein